MSQCVDEYHLDTCRWNLDQPLSSGIRGVALHHCHRHSIRTATFQAGGLGTYSFRKGDCIINIIPYGRLVTLDKMQRPNASVPNGYSALGVAYLANKFDSIGSLGANRNPIKKNTITSIGMKSIHHFRKRIAFI